MTKFGLNWRRKGDKVRFFDMEFNTIYQLNSFIETFLIRDVVNETLELRIWKLN